MSEREPVMRNRHHALWPRAEFRTPIERNLRNMGALIIRGVNAVYHQDLHHELVPPPKLEAVAQHDLYRFLLDHHSGDDVFTEGVEWAMIWASRHGYDEFERNLGHQVLYVTGEYLVEEIA